jgi:hypothetical protein
MLSKASLQSLPSVLQNDARGKTKVVECLPIKCEALSSNPSTTKKKKSKMNAVALYIMFLGFL